MADPADLARRIGPLAALGERLREASCSAVMLREIRCVAQVGLRGDPGDARFRNVMRAALGFDLPGAGRTAGASLHRALWLGPNEWLIAGLPGDEIHLVPRVEAALGAARGAVVDLTAARAVLELAGPASRAVLMKGCSLDLHPRGFAPGQCAQTLLARAGIILELADAAPTWRMYVRRSVASYLALWLTDAMLEFRGSADHSRE
jgi:sarcosine oxidase subunit gamma